MAVVAVKMPQLGESVTEGTVDRWLKSEGDFVARDEPLVEVVTDKVNAEIPSPFEGTLVRIDATAGATVPIGSTIAQMEVAAEPAAPMPQPEPPVAAAEPSAIPSPPPVAAAGRLSPAVRRLAEVHGLDLATIRGTGRGGRITRADLLALVGASENGAGKVSDAGPDEELLPLTAVRRQIAEHMVRSAAIPHAWGTREVEMTALVRYREEQKDGFLERHGIALSYLPFVIQVVCDALRANPLQNSSWRDDGIVLKKRIHLGIAVGLPDAVIVPVIRDADQLGLVDLARAVEDLVTRARDKRLRPDDVRGGTFTLNNTGALGGHLGMAIINHPQAAILNTEAVERRPVVRGDDIVIRDIMNVTLSFDHRIVDGLHAGRFLRAVQSGLEGFTPAQIRI